MIIIINKSELPYKDEDSFIYDYYHNPLLMDKYQNAVLQYVSTNYSFLVPCAGDKIIVKRHPYKVVSKIIDYSSEIYVVIVE